MFADVTYSEIKPEDQTDPLYCFACKGYYPDRPYLCVEMADGRSWILCQDCSTKVIKKRDEIRNKRRCQR